MECERVHGLHSFEQMCITNLLVISAVGSNISDLTQSQEHTHSKNKSRTIGRTSSIKNERTKSKSILFSLHHVTSGVYKTLANGHRSRSNSAFQVPNWLRKKRAGRAAELERTQRPVYSIEELFEVFKKTAIIQIDPLSKYIVSRRV